jgi:hypothetical protein
MSIILRLSGHTGLLRIAPFVVLVGTTGCAIPQQSRSPFDDRGSDDSGSQTRPGGSRNFRVEFEVGCANCLIVYTAGHESSSHQASATDRIWSRSRSIDLWPSEELSLRLVATPRAGGSPVRFVRILVNREVVATSGDDGGMTTAPDPGPLWVETVITAPPN